MSKTQVERAGYLTVATMTAEERETFIVGSPVKMTEDFKVGLAASGDEQVGVAMQVHASGVYTAIAVGLRGPVLRVTAGESITYGNQVSAKVTAGDGKWYTGEAGAEDTVAIALESADEDALSAFPKELFNQLRGN